VTPFTKLLSSQVRLHAVDRFRFGCIDALLGFFAKGGGVIPVAAAESVKKTGDVALQGDIPGRTSRKRCTSPLRREGWA
jgi:hypothetical protein